MPKQVEQHLVRFTKQTNPYNSGETAAFQPRVARRLVAGKEPVAVYVNPPKGYDEHGQRLAKAKDPEGLRNNGGGWYELLEFLDENDKPVTCKGKDAAIALREDLIAEAAAKAEAAEVAAQAEAAAAAEADSGGGE